LLQLRNRTLNSKSPKNGLFNLYFPDPEVYPLNQDPYFQETCDFESPPAFCNQKICNFICDSDRVEVCNFREGLLPSGGLPHLLRLPQPRGPFSAIQGPTTPSGAPPILTQATSSSASPTARLATSYPTKLPHHFYGGQA